MVIASGQRQAHGYYSYLVLQLQACSGTALASLSVGGSLPTLVTLVSRNMMMPFLYLVTSSLENQCSLCSVLICSDAGALLLKAFYQLLHRSML